MKIENLYELYLECNSVNTDTRQLKKNDIFFALKGDNFNGNEFARQAIEKGAKYAVIDEEKFVQKNTILVDDALKSLQNLASFHRKQLKVPIIALTGSNGKTTTKELISKVLEKKFKVSATTGNLNNHIGVPLSLLSLTSQTEIGVIEMGANHQKEIEFLCQIAQPDYGLITNFGKAHLEGFGGVEGVIKGKSELYEYLTKYEKTVFINGDDDLQLKQIGNYKEFIKFGSGNENDCKINFIEANPFVKLKYKNVYIKSKLIGSYNFTNIAFAIAIGNYFEVNQNDIKNAIEDYDPQNNRSQILSIGSNEIILDAYNANPTSMKVALQSFSKINNGHKIAFLGDMFELGDDSETEHQNIVDLSIDQHIDQVILIGSNFYKTNFINKNIHSFEKFDDFLDRFDISKLNNSSILIKGSRGMKMERIIDLLKENQ